jgi:hypothetical protein
MTELLRATADTLATKEAAARLDGELAAPPHNRLKPRFQMGAKLSLYHPGGRLGCNRSCAHKLLGATCEPAATGAARESLDRHAPSKVADENRIRADRIMSSVCRASSAQGLPTFRSEG